MMLALTIRQPYATAYVRRVKPLENRTWALPSRLIGQWLAVHAAAADPVLYDDVAELWPDCPDEYDCGAVIGAVRIARCLPWTEDLGPWATGPWCWVADAAVELAAPIEARGQQRLWAVGHYAETEIRRAIRRAA
jgi:hypothetical protein